jgi:hypothetical protein
VTIAFQASVTLFTRRQRFVGNILALFELCAALLTFVFVNRHLRRKKKNVNSIGIEQLTATAAVPPV